MRVLFFQVFIKIVKCINYFSVKRKKILMGTFEKNVLEIVRQILLTLLLLLLLLLLSRLSRVRLCATPQMAAHQAPTSLGFSKQEHWSGLPFPSPMQKSESEVAQSCLTLSDPMDCSLPGSSVHGIFQARVLECHTH